LSFAASCMNSLSVIVAAKACLRIATRSAGTPGGVAKGRPRRFPKPEDPALLVVFGQE